MQRELVFLPLQHMIYQRYSFNIEWNIYLLKACASFHSLIDVHDREFSKLFLVEVLKHNAKHSNNSTTTKVVII